MAENLIEKLKRIASWACRSEYERVSAREAAAEIGRLRRGIQDYLDGNYDHPRAHRHEPAMGCKHGRYYYEDCCECDAAYFSALLGEECIARGQSQDDSK